MSNSQTLIRRYLLSWIAALSLMLTACGGGSDTVATYVSPPPPPPIALTASKGALSKYTGIWTSECGQVYSGSVVNSARNNYQFGASSNSTMTATISQWQYTDYSCRTPYALTNTIPLVQKLTLTFVATASLNIDTSENKAFTGDIDQFVSTKSTGTSTIYFGLSDGEATLRESSGTSFSTIALKYSKLK
jgi:hypothetical protein